MHQTEFGVDFYESVSPSCKKPLSSHCLFSASSGTRQARGAPVPGQEPKVYPRDRRAWPAPQPPVLKSSGVFLRELRAALRSARQHQRSCDCPPIVAPPPLHIGASARPAATARERHERDALPESLRFFKTSVFFPHTRVGTSRPKWKLTRVSSSS